MARKFQGYARGRGFSARNAGSAAVSRIQEQGNKATSGLKEQLSRKRALDQQYVSDLDSNFRRGQAIQDEIKRFDDKALNLQQRNIEVNQATALENIKTEGANQARMYEQLSELSETLGKSGAQIANAIEDAATKGAFVQGVIDLNNPPTPVEIAGEEQLRKANAQTDSDLAKQVNENGLPPNIHQQQKKNSAYAALKNTDARIKLATDAYLARATYDNYGNELVHDILDEFNLYGVRPSRLYEFATQVSQKRSSFEAAQRRIDAINTSTETVNKVLSQLINNPTQDNFRHYVQTVSTSTTDGRVTITRTEMLDQVFESLENLGFTDEQIDSFMDLDMVDENGESIGETYGQRFEKTRALTLINNRRQGRIDKIDQQNKVIKAEQLDNFIKTREEIIKLGAGGKIDLDTYSQSLDDLDVSNDQRKQLYEMLYDISNDRVNNDALIKEADYLINNGMDASHVVSRMTGKPLATYTDKNNKLKRAVEESGVSEKDNRKRLYNAGKIRLGISNVGTVNDPSLDFATDDRLVKVQLRRAELMRTKAMDYQSANTAAMGEILDAIATSELPEYATQGLAKGGVKGRGTRKSTSNYYEYYSPGGTYFEKVVQANTHQALQAVRARPDSRKDVFLVPTDNLAGIYSAIVGRKVYELPNTIKQLQKAYPDTLQLQLNKYAEEFGKPPITVPLTFQQVLSQQQQDKRAQQFMMQVDTIQEERIIPLVADDSTKMSQFFMNRPVVVKQNYFQMKAQGGPTDMQSGKQYLEGMGFPSRGAAYIAGNIQQESSWDGMRSWGQVMGDGTSRNGGLPSWASWANAPARLGAAEAYLGKPIEQATHAEQLEYIEHEMRTKYPEAYAIFSDPNANAFELKKASKMYWGYGHEGDRYKFAEELL